MYNSCLSRVIAIRSGPTNGLHVFVNSIHRAPDVGISVITDPKWLNLGGSFQEVDLSRLEGRNFPSKLELLMATLTWKRLY
jgi:hypothetical protein